MAKKFEKGKMVPVPSHSIIPERDIDKSPILECSHLGIDFGGLKAVDDFNLTIDRWTYRAKRRRQDHSV